MDTHHAMTIKPSTPIAATVIDGTPVVTTGIPFRILHRIASAAAAKDTQAMTDAYTDAILASQDYIYLAPESAESLPASVAGLTPADLADLPGDLANAVISWAIGETAKARRPLVAPFASAPETPS